jgi:hypothetical protein
MTKYISAEAHKLPPEQWVNIYEITLTGDTEFYDYCQVKDLGNLDDPSEYCLELIEEGKIIPGEALK